MKSKYCITVISLIALLMFGFYATKAAYADNDDFSQADYQRALNGDKNLQNAKLEKANLQGINLSGANLQHADLEEANLQNADLTCANLQHADLEEANLKGAKINGAKFRGAKLEYTVWTDGRTCGEDSVGSCW